MIRVCPLSRLNDTVEACRARHVITLVRDETRALRPGGIDPDKHLWLQMDDIAEPIDGMIAPNTEHVAQLVEFVGRWDRAQPLVIHCFAGISRSTAAAFIAACSVSPDREDVFARRLRAASPTATPNSRLIALADNYLQRDGRMVRAISRIGLGQIAYEAMPFELQID